MGKGNGNTRSSAQGGYTPSPYEGASEEMLESMRDILYKGKGIADFSREQWMVWDDMDTDDRELMLMQADFTGMEDDTQGGEIDIPVRYNIKDLGDMAVEAVVNNWYGFNGTNDNVFYVGLRDGTFIDADEIEPPTGYKPTWASKRQYAEAKKALQLSKASFIINNNASETAYAYKDDKGKAALKQSTGWEEWKNGRGEKRRQYIQDDWI